MKNIFDESENLSLEERITILSDMINGLCDRFDRFERILLKIEDSISVDNLRLKEQECISTSSDDGVDRMQKQSWGMLQVENDTKNVSSEVSFAEENNASEPFSSQIRYCGQPAGCGFEIYYETFSIIGIIPLRDEFDRFSVESRLLFETSRKLST